MVINLERRHVETCLRWASMRRTLEQAAHLLATSDHDEEELGNCIWELSQITPCVEAMQFAVREATRNQGLC